MYPEELENFIREKGYRLGGDDLLFAIDVIKHPQLNHIEFDVFECKYKIWDKYGNYYEFDVIPYQEYQKLKWKKKI